MLRGTAIHGCALFPSLSAAVIPSVVEGSWLDLNTGTVAGNFSAGGPNGKS
jgi:hypothetical protein